MSCSRWHPFNWLPMKAASGSLRHGNRPIGFLLKETEPGSLLTSEILEEWIVESLKIDSAPSRAGGLATSSGN
jgi:hypothetical protein